MSRVLEKIYSPYLHPSISSLKNPFSVILNLTLLMLMHIKVISFYSTLSLLWAYYHIFPSLLLSFFFSFHSCFFIETTHNAGQTHYKKYKNIKDFILLFLLLFFLLLKKCLLLLLSFILFSYSF